MTRFEKIVLSATAICFSLPAFAVRPVTAPGPETDISIAAVAVLAVGYVWMRRKAKLLRA